MSVWSLINYTHDYDIFSKTSEVLKGLSLPVSPMEDVEAYQGGPVWDMPLVDGVSISRIEVDTAKKAASLIKKALAKSDKTLREAQALQEKHKDQPEVVACLRYYSFGYQAGYFTKEQLQKTIEKLSKPSKERAKELLEALGGEEKARFVFDGAQKYLDWVSEAAQHKMGIVFFLE